jgi:hypothetical protein
VKRLACASAASLLFAWAPPLRAAEGDGVYGRFDGDLTLRAEAGAAFAPGGPSLSVGAAALYLGTAGVYAAYTDAFGSGMPCGPGPECGGPEVRRSIAAGVVMQPLFIARYATNQEHGPAHWDLLVDSFAMEVGAFWAAPRGAGLRAEPGLELALGIALPILARASGPYLGLRGAMRIGAEETHGLGGLSPSGLLSLTLGYSQVVGVHIVDAGDGVHR